MVKILSDINRLNQSELETRAILVYKKMNANPKYVSFNDSILILGALSAAYTKALFEEDGSNVKRDIKNNAKDEIKAFMTKFSKKIEVAANDLPTEEEAIVYAKGTGFTVAEASTKKASVDFLETPTNFKVVDDDRRGAALLTWKRVVGAIIYLIEELNKDGVWESRGTSTQPSVIVPGTESEVKRTFRIKASAADTVTSEYTEGVSVWVH